MKDLSLETKDLVRQLYDAIGTPLANRLARALELGDWETIARSKVDPRDYTDAQEYFLDAQAASLLRKCKDLPTPASDRRASAIENWRQGEVDCYKTNERLSPYLEGRTHPEWNGDVARFNDLVREKIASVLGRCPAMEHLVPKHGPGATFSNPFDRSTVADKMQESPSLTPHSIWFLLDWVGTAWGREAVKRGVVPVFVRGNRFSTALKDATKDRPTGAEPSLAVFYQLGLAQPVRRALKSVGIDLDSGQETHKALAREASITGALATLDLKNASDTVAYNLVRLVLPPDWFRLFDELRSPFTRISAREAKAFGLRAERTASGKHIWVKLEKFSSMGNGFTFELETLIFWALVRSAVEADGGGPESLVKVYGDDIICESRHVRAVTAVLRFYGFTLNLEKSFWEGPFRESCGGDFWVGRPVRPVFLKESLDEPQQLIAAANQVRRAAFDLFGGLGRFTSAWHAIHLHLPSGVRRCRGPESLGDIVIHDEEDKWGWTSGRRDRILCYRPVKTKKVSLQVFSKGTVLACGLYGATVGSGFLIPRDSVLGYAIRRVVPYGTSWLPRPRIVTQPAEQAIPVGSVRTGPNYDVVRRIPRSAA